MRPHKHAAGPDQGSGGRARALAWINANLAAWTQGYYVKDQDLSPEDAQYLVGEVRGLCSLYAR